MAFTPDPPLGPLRAVTRRLDCMVLHAGGSVALITGNLSLTVDSPITFL